MHNRHFINQISSRIKRPLWGIALAAPLLGGLVWSHVAFSAPQGLQLSSSQQLSMGMAFTELKPADSVTSYGYPALLSLPAPHIQLLATPVDGLVTRILKVHGAVKAGEAIVELQSAELLKLQKTYLATLSELVVAEAEVSRARKLIQAGSVSQKQLQSAESQVTKLKQQAQQQSQDLLLMGMAEEALARLQNANRLQSPIIAIRAPADGELFELSLSAGTRLQAGEPVAKFAELDMLVAGVNVPIEVAKTLHVGQAARLLQQGTVGEIAYISHQADPLTQQVEVHCRFPNPQLQLTVGALVEVSFINEVTAGRHFAVPLSALTNVDGQTTLFMRSPLDSAQIRPLAVEAVEQPGQTAVVTFMDDAPVDIERWSVLSMGTAAMLSVMAAQTEAGE
ncbi:MAG: efflux RND transporter periplasmic adaptor subunit [Gammaproteobacteria bacterium]|nr:efflux RND transporter periplasmic adaptor subunit [Gammaproteobacteria bacterium]